MKKLILRMPAMDAGGGNDEPEKGQDPVKPTDPKDPDKDDDDDDDDNNDGHPIPLPGVGPIGPLPKPEK